MSVSNPIIIENQKEGDENWRLTQPAIHREIEGYASRASATYGESIALFVSTKSEQFSLTVFRMGWYNGKGARQVLEPITLKGSHQEKIIADPETGMVKCDWTASYALNIEQTWTTGVYLVKLEELKENKQSYIIFVVRNDAEPNDVLFQLPVTTYQAYNFWGGKSLYDWGSGSDTEWGTIDGARASKVSFDRPYIASNNTSAAFGMGAGEFLTNVQPVTTHGYPINSAAWDYNMVRWLERQGYHLGYTTSLDTHERPEQLLSTKVFLSQGHDEYWSYEMRKNLENARNQGINLTFFSSNSMFWQVRFEKDSDQEEPRTMVCYKDQDMDPIKGERSTINFRDIKELKGEAEIIGVQYIADPVIGDVKVSNAQHWVFEGTGLKNGDTLKGLLGYEVDSVCEDSPANVEILGATPAKKIDEYNTKYILTYMGAKIAGIFKSVGEKLIGVRIGNKALLAVMLVLGGFGSFVFIKFIGLPFLLALIGLGALAMILWFLKIYYSKNIVSNMTLYKADSGAMVFSTGSMQWSWGLDDFNVGTLRKSYRSEQAEKITANILNKFIGN